MTKSEIVRKIHLKTGIPSNVLATVLNEFLLTVKTEMANGNNIYLRGFGTFVIRHYAAKNAYNINDGTFRDIPAHNVPTFKPGRDMMEGVRSDSE